MSFFLYFFHPRNLQSLGHIFSAVLFIIFLIGLFYIWKKRFYKVVFINFVILVFLLTPVLFYFESKHPPLVQKRILENFPETPFTQPDSVLGRRPHSGKWIDQEWLNGSEIYKKQYTINDLGFRVLPSKIAPKVILFYGCSQTFGQGVDDDENFPALIQKNLPQYRSINLGLPGAGTSHMLRLVANQTEKNFLKNEEVDYAFYGFIASHMKRNDFSLSWVQPSPWYELKADGSLIDRGLFTPDKNLTFQLFFEHWSSYFKQRFFATHGDYPQTEFNLFLQLVKESQQALKKRYPKIKFGILFLQNEFLPETYILALKKQTVDEGGIFIDFPKQTPECFKLPSSCTYPDGHFNKLGHEQIAQKLIESLKNQK